MTQEEAFEFLSQGIDISKMNISGDAEYIAKHFEAEGVAIKMLGTVVRDTKEKNYGI